MTFEKRNTVREKLRTGKFCIFLEYAVPATTQDLKLALAPGMEMAKYAGAEERVTALIVGPGPPVGSRPDIYDVAGHIRNVCATESVVAVTGHNGDIDSLRKTVAGLDSLGVTSVLALTGDVDPDHPRDKRGVPVYRPNAYLDSCRMIRIIRANCPEMTVGAAVNPFKYNVADNFLQYFKMIRKLNTGADFISTQAGWDMKKYQELQWFLRSRSISEPVVARLMMVSPDEVTGIVGHQRAGLVMSHELGALIQRESALNEKQAMSAQIRRLSLQAAGCKLFGYSGIQIAGLPDAKTAKAVVKRITESLDGIDSYESWLNEWNDFHNRIEMAPYPDRYYVFKDLMTPEYPDYDPDAVRQTDTSLPEPTRGDKIRYNLARALHLQKFDNPPVNLLKGPLCGYRKGRDWNLERTFNVCAAGCPKGLEDGPCGGSLPDGTCEFGHQACIFHKIIALADWQNKLEMLEEPYED